MMADLLAMLVRLATGVSIGRVDSWTGKPCVFFANHGSNLDALVIWSALPGEIRRETSPVAAMDYWTKNWLRRWISGEIFHAILLQRKGRPDDRSHPLQAVYDMLETGRSIIIFPEGTRSPDGSLNPFKPGIFHLKEKFPELVMIPVSLQNLNRILPKGQRLPLPLIGRITVHPPLSHVEGEGREDFLKRARNTVASGLQKTLCDE
ncbi:MAG: 1-acyl-sn-glycerol-3-phosphate acyltransferase [Akkermansiaceae bacterium]|jgi:1-acyl-sn-glycerol-3-phosphate acyltransferase|nr:1-acyl-sn-glycerol-3-phosphate acyltransferase [Akkermansiaceae bacterium]MDP4647859.1 1-acyl-sn-glycerol-3-phosphate acyltransferase [Akkermansiaceae bacterium]MDP4722035.1 1-acyl-sn-glycerol-3-phosphate acyltransferase [Akkermansiaceae bacterium]MDP4780524.1 1-acyl-sn-glycerol-3-phosphate acyltransferase [Akkermansiaceae bacterium]MDP4846124.1 1-acyl-sn-glycerol-3-phosphate acyltransferase [Akkermansiaceae bacterium]